MARELGDTWWVDAALSELAELAAAQGRYDEAETWLRQRQGLWDADDRMPTYWERVACAELARACGDASAARTMLTDALQILEQGLPNPLNKPRALGLLGLVACDQCDYAEVHACLRESLALSGEYHHKLYVAKTQQWLGRVAREAGNLEEARDRLKASLALHRDMGTRVHLVEVLEEMAALAVVAGQPVEATRLYAATASLRDSLGAPLSVPDRALPDRYQAALSAIVPEIQAMTLEQAVAYALGLA